MVRWHKTSALASTGAEIAMTAPSKEDEAGEWDTMFERLKNFKQAKGHCQADQETSDDAELGRWGELSLVVVCLSDMLVVLFGVA